MSDMYRVLLDTNVLLDVLVEGRPEHADAWELLEWCNGSGDMGMACSLSFKDVYYVLQRDLPEPKARAAVKKLMEFLIIAPIDAEATYEAVTSNEPDFEDGLVRRCAELNGADFIITRDRKAFAYSTIKCMSAKEYMDFVKTEDRAILSEFFNA